MNALQPIAAQVEGHPLALYDAMVTAIAECSRVDEVKTIRDKAMALQVYYRQSANFEAEREAARIRIRAERRYGKLAQELERAKTPNPQGVGGKTGKVATSDLETQQSPYAEALERTGVSRQKAHRFQALADIPEKAFEAALTASEKPSTNGVIRAVTPIPEPAASDEALWLWGRLRDFERKGYLTTNPRRLLTQMTKPMMAEVVRLVPLVREFLEKLETAREPV